MGKRPVALLRVDVPLTLGGWWGCGRLLEIPRTAGSRRFRRGRRIGLRVQGPDGGAERVFAEMFDGPGVDRVEPRPQLLEGTGGEPAGIGGFPGEGHLVSQPGIVLRVEPAEAGSVDAHIPGVVVRLVRFPEDQVRGCEKGRFPAGIIFAPACLGFLFLPLVRGLCLPVRWLVRDGFRRGLFHHDSQQAHEGRLL